MTKQDFWTKLDRLCPPGETYTRVWSAFVTILILCFGIWWAGLFSLLGEVNNYKINVAQGFYSQWDTAPSISTVSELLYLFLVASRFSVLILLCYAIPNYQYFRKDSKSVYLMKRVKDPMEIHRLCWSVPLMTAGAVLVVSVLLYGIFVLIYLNCVPAGCMPADPFGR
jgi:hypothetical protein